MTLIDLIFYWDLSFSYEISYTSSNAGFPQSMCWFPEGEISSWKFCRHWMKEIFLLQLSYLSWLVPQLCVQNKNNFNIFKSANETMRCFRSAFLHRHRRTQCKCSLHCPACRTTLVATRFRVAVICPIIQVPHYIRVFFYFVWFVFINYIFQFYNELCTYCNILDIYLS